MPVTKDVAAWGMRMLLGVEPPNDELVDFHRQGYETLEALRTSFLRTPEARSLYEAANIDRIVAIRAIEKGQRYQIPPFLLRRPSLPDVPWEFREPDLVNPTSQLCTAEQMTSETYRSLCGPLGLDPSLQARKCWEFVYIYAVLQKAGLLVPGMKGLGFGTGHEPLPSAFAAAGVAVLATDAPPDLMFSSNWAEAGQWTAGLEALWLPNLLPRERFFKRVTFQPIDMNAIPADVTGFDFCWSACCLEHLGSIRKGLDFIRNSLHTLRPGGVAVHTTEFNLLSETDTLELSDIVLFRKRDIETVIHELVQDGHKVEPLNTWPGATLVDEYIDVPPYGPAHLKLQIAAFTTTSFGLVVTKDGLSDAARR